MADLCVSRVPLFAGLVPEDLQALSELARPVSLPPGSLAQDEESASRLLVVHAGQLREYRLSRDGREQLLRVLGPGDYTGESGALTGRPSGTRVEAVEPTVACAFTHRDLVAFLLRHPHLMLRMVTNLSTRLEQAEERLAGLIDDDVTTRLARYLIELPSSQRDGVHVVALPLAKKDIASMLGTTPESLSRALSRMAHAGVLETRGREVRLLDPAALVSLTE